MISTTTFNRKISRAIFLLAFGISLAAFACADEDVKEKPIYGVGTATTVTISAADWTKVPTASTLNRRSGVKVSNPATNSATLYGVISTGTTPTEATTVHPIEIQPGENPFIPVGDGMNLFLLSSSGSVSAHVQEVRQ